MTCPVCQRPSDERYRPFCTKRCADVDLARWMTGGYAIPSNDPQDIDAAIEAVERLARDDQAG